MLRALLLNRKFNQDLLWNYGSLAVLAFSGILINLIIAGQYGAEALGIFNQVYAVYVMASQFAVGGLQYSALKHVAEGAGDRCRQGQAAWSGVCIVLVWAVPLAAMVYLLSGVIGAVMDSVAVGRAMGLAAPGLAFFALNKVLLGILNGLRHMREFAIGQALRYLLMIAYVLTAVFLGLPGYWLGATFTVAEVALTVFLVAMVVPHVPLAREAFSLNWLKTHAAFGFKGFLSGVILESNARVDVVMLGLFLSDRAVGIYSFASMLAEGFYNLLGVVRNNVNPILVQMLKEDRFVDIQAMVRQLQWYLYPTTAGLALLLVGLYRPAVQLVLGGGEFLQK